MAKKWGYLQPFFGYHGQKNYLCAYFFGLCHSGPNYDCINKKAKYV